MNLLILPLVQPYTGNHLVTGEEQGTLVLPSKEADVAFNRFSRVRTDIIKHLKYRSKAFWGFLKLSRSQRERGCQGMTVSYKGHRFPPEIISHAVWLYHQICLSFRDVEDLLAERRVETSYETIRRCCLKFGPRYRRALKRREGRLGEDWHVD